MEIDFVALREQDKVRLWAVDLNICASSSLSNFQLFDFLAAGQLDPGSGTYWIPSMTGMLDPSVSNSTATQQQPSSAADTEGQSGAVTAYEQAHGQSMAQQASSQLTDAEGQAALQQAQTDGMGVSGAATVCQGGAIKGMSVGRGDRNAQTSVPDSVAESALQQDAAPRPLTGESDAGMTDQYAVETPEDHVGAFEDAAQTLSIGQDNAVVMGSGVEVWQAAPPEATDEDVQLEPRYYTAIDILYHGGMLKQRSTHFLQNCRLAHLGFDMMGRQGLVLNFMDSLSSGCVGVQCSAPTPQAALQGLANVSLDIFSLLMC